MKLCRYGKSGYEKPGMIDSEGKLRDLSKIVDNIGPNEISPRGLKMLTRQIEWHYLASELPRRSVWISRTATGGGGSGAGPACVKARIPWRGSGPRHHDWVRSMGGF